MTLNYQPNQFLTRTVKKGLERDRLSKMIYCVAVLLSFSIFSCAPLTKESYMEDYAGFIDQVTQESKNYDEKEWVEIEEDYEKFSGKWREKFKDEFTNAEKLMLTKYEVQFNVVRVKKTSTGIMDMFK